MDVRRDLLLIFKEAVNNAARHSRCSAVEIDLRVDGSRLVLMVSGQRRRLRRVADSDGHGLASMRRRARRSAERWSRHRRPGRDHGDGRVPI